MGIAAEENTAQEHRQELANQSALGVVGALALPQAALVLPAIATLNVVLAKQQAAAIAAQILAQQEAQNSAQAQKAANQIAPGAHAQQHALAFLEIVVCLFAWTKQTLGLV